MLSVFATPNDLGGETPVLLHAVQPKDLESFLAHARRASTSDRGAGSGHEAA